MRFATLVVFVATAFAARAEPPDPAAIWREFVTHPGETQLVSYGENGYRVTLVVEAARQDAMTAGARLAFTWSEIDTSKDEPAWGKPRKLAGLPAGVVVGAGGVWFLKGNVGPKALARVPKGPATFSTGASGIVERVLEKGPAWCFSDPKARTKKGGTPVELCLAPGVGLVAAKGLVPSLGPMLFAREGWGRTE